MADIEHNLLTDPQLHEPKGIVTATGNQVYVSSGLGSGAWTDQVIRFESADIGTEFLLDSASTQLTQVPAGLSIPLQVEFGAATGTPADPVSLDVDGTIHINQAGTYHLSASISLGRIGAANESLIFVRSLVNGTPVGLPKAYRFDDDKQTHYVSFDNTYTIAAGTTYTLEIIRDSAGHNSGGLYAEASSEGWGTAPSSRVQVSRFV